MSVLCNNFIKMVHAKFLNLGYYSYPEKESYFLTTFFKPNLLAFNFIWENMDNLKIVNNYLKDNGYEVLVIWEYDLKHNKIDTFNKIIEYARN